MRLTRRQKDVLTLVSAGNSDKEAGRVLGIEAVSVKTHAWYAVRALGAKNRPHAVAIAMRAGLLS